MRTTDVNYEVTISLAFPTGSNEQLSMAIQKRAYELGYRWVGEDETYFEKDREVIYLESEGVLRHSTNRYLDVITDEDDPMPGAIVGSLDTLFYTDEYLYTEEN